MTDKPIDTKMPIQSAPRDRRQLKQKEARERMARALELRMAGCTYQVIADQLGYATRDSAQKAIKAALKDITREAAQQVKELELGRLDKALLYIWPQVQKGSLGAVDRFIRIQHQRAQLLGLYAPQKIAPTTPDGMEEWTGKSDSELVTEFEKLLEAQRARAGDPTGGGTPAAGAGSDSAPADPGGVAK